MRAVIRTPDELIAAGVRLEGDDTIYFPEGEYLIEGFTIDAAELQAKLLACEGKGPIIFRDITIVGAGAD